MIVPVVGLTRPPTLPSVPAYVKASHDENVNNAKQLTNFDSPEQRQAFEEQSFADTHLILLLW
jgi:hypothetical protein